jgi:hypothetical protein
MFACLGLLGISIAFMFVYPYVGLTTETFEKVKSWLTGAQISLLVVIALLSFVVYGTSG